MNTTTKVIAGVAVIALLFAGIGYALTYTAETTSTENKVGAAYITLNEGIASADAKLIGSGSKINFDTVTENGDVTYTFKDLTINPGEIFLKSNNLDDVSSVTLTITETTTNVIDGKFSLMIGEKSGSYDSATKKWTVDDVKIDKNGIKHTVTFKLKEAQELDPSVKDTFETGINFKIEASVTV